MCFYYKPKPITPKKKKKVYNKQRVMHYSHKSKKKKKIENLTYERI